MNETKNCPYCGEEILAIAKKCKHCGEWLDQQPVKEFISCPACGEQVEKGAVICPHCQEPLGNIDDETRIVDKQNQEEQATEAAISSKDFDNPEDTTTSENVESSDIQEDLSLWDYFFKCLKKYATFSGRARRKELWSFYLFQSIAVITMFILEVNFFSVSSKFSGFGLLIIIIGLLIPGIAVFVRRLHDIGKSGWWYLILFIPFIGVLAWSLWAWRHGDVGENEYGPDPIPDKEYYNAYHPSKTNIKKTILGIIGTILLSGIICGVLIAFSSIGKKNFSDDIDAEMELADFDTDDIDGIVEAYNIISELKADGAELDKEGLKAKLMDFAAAIKPEMEKMTGILKKIEEDPSKAADAMKEMERLEDIEMVLSDMENELNELPLYKEIEADEEFMKKFQEAMGVPEDM